MAIIMLFSETFLQNVRCRRNFVNVQELIKAYNCNSSGERKEKITAINKIFPPKAYGGASLWKKAIIPKNQDNVSASKPKSS